MGKSGSKNRCYLVGDYIKDLEQVMNFIDKDVVMINQYPIMFDLLSK